MSRSIKRVEAAARHAGLELEIVRMPESTRTAGEAAAACGCEVGQIVKSLVFEGERTGRLKLLLVSGRHDVDLSRAEALFGEPLKRADPRKVREETGFAIGGVAPFGHLCAIETFMDDHLTTYPEVWAAAGAPNTVFSATPDSLHRITAATLFCNRAR